MRAPSNFGELVSLVWLARARADEAVASGDRALACSLVDCFDAVAALPHPGLARLCAGARDRTLIALGHAPGPLKRELVA